MITRPKNRPSSFAVPKVISVSCECIATTYLRADALHRTSLSQRSSAAPSKIPTPKIPRLPKILRRGISLRGLGDWRSVLALAQQLLKAREEVHRDGEDHGGIFLDADFRQRLQVAELHADGFGGQQMGGVHQALRG